ncbi:MAG: ribonuclease D [Acidobacteria bacterium]|nr:ribonuclease D [Acidobacteriota bacterium]
MINQTVEYIGDQNKLTGLIKRIKSVSALALDIETINWWDRDAERVALIQLAYREDPSSKAILAESPIQVVIIDALAEFDLSELRWPLEFSSMPKVIHNASYDAVRLAKHFGINTSPIFDTMLAARRNGEKKCSLKAQVGNHLGYLIDKAEQRSDWGRRPLTKEQLEYAALDASCTLLLYERQLARGLRGDYELAYRIEKRSGHSVNLPFDSSRDDAGMVIPNLLTVKELNEISALEDLRLEGLALLGIIAELNGRYSPEQLAASVGKQRIGLAGWIVDHVLGFEEELDEFTVKEEIRILCERELVTISLSRRLNVTARGVELWKRNMPDNTSETAAL